MMADDKDDPPQQPQDPEIPDWLAGGIAAGAAALGAWWLGKKIFGGSPEMTHDRAMKILRDTPILNTTPEQRAEFEKAMSFLLVERRREQGFPVDDDYSKE